MLTLGLKVSSVINRLAALAASVIIQTEDLQTLQTEDLQNLETEG